MTDGTVIITTDGPVLTLRINRPGHENRLNLAVLRALGVAFRQADADPGVRTVVVRGTGETFCCGGDLAEFAVGGEAVYREFAKHFADVHLTLRRLSKPVLAAVNGHARAGGMSLLASCDLAIARASAHFGMPEIKAGIWPVMAMVLLNRVLPRKKAFELYYFGQSFDAQQARALDLVNWVVPDDEFEAAVHGRSRQLAALPRSALSVGRTTFGAIEDRSVEDGYAYSAERLVELLTDPDVARMLGA